MNSIRITTTQAHELQSLRKSGHAVTDHWQQLQNLLEIELSLAHARLLAEPQLNPASGETDWYASGDGPVVPLSSLPEAEQSALRQSIDRLLGEIGELAHRLRASQAPQERFKADILDLARTIPGHSYVYAVGDQPVLVAWGHSAVGMAAERVTLEAVRDMPPPPMVILPPPVIPAPSRSFLPLYVTLLAGLAALVCPWLVWAHRSSALTPPVAQCEIQPTQRALFEALRSAQEHLTSLQAQLAALSTERSRAAAQCEAAVIEDRGKRFAQIVESH